MVALSACVVTYMVIHVCLLAIKFALSASRSCRLAPGWCSISLLAILGPLPHILICGVLLFTILCHKNSNDDGSHSQNEYYHHSNHSTNNGRHTPWLTSRAWKVTRIKLSHTQLQVVQLAIEYHTIDIQREHFTNGSQSQTYPCWICLHFCIATNVVYIHAGQIFQKNKFNKSFSLTIRLGCQLMKSVCTGVIVNYKSCTEFWQGLALLEVRTNLQVGLPH